MPLTKSPSRAAFVSNLKAELTAGKPRDQALAIAYSVKRRSKAGGGPVNTYGGAFGAFSPGEEAEFAPSPVGTAVGHIAKRLVHDLPKEAIENAANYQPGLRRADYTDIPGPEPVEPLIGNAGEAALNTMGGTAFAAPRGAVGAGPSRLPRQALDMSEEARLARANQQGYTTDAYHGTRVPEFDRFKRKPSDVGVHFGTPEQAFDRLHYQRDRVPSGAEGERIMPVKLKLKNPLRMPDIGMWGSDNLDWGLRNLRKPDGVTPLFDPEEILRAMYGTKDRPGPGNEAGKVAALRDLIESKGYDGIVYKNTGEVAGSEPYRAAERSARARVDEAFGSNKYSFSKEEQSHPAYQEWQKAQDSYRRHRETMGEDSYIAFRPEQAKSRFAAFDPQAKGKILGAGAADKRGAAPAALANVDKILERERALKGATNEPATPAAATLPEQPAAAAESAAVGPGGGGSAGARSLDEAQAAAARWAGNRQALEGIPGPLKIGEDYFVPGPIGKIHDVAEDYMRQNAHLYGLPADATIPSKLSEYLDARRPKKYYPLDVEHSKAIAQAFEEMKHTPNDKATKAAYDALIDETAAQYQAIKKTGLKIEPIPAGAPDPYAANPRLAAVDVAENNHLWFFPTEGGFGTVNKISDNPLLRKTGEKIGDHELLANDMFRIVHDYFGHLKQGHGFRAAGEDNAWRTHAAMYSDLARPAMTTETRGQNSWVNYGPHGDKNRTASGADTVYADQKIGLMPDWVMYDRGQAPPMMYHGSAADYLKPSLERIGSGQGQMAYGAGYYGSAKEGVAKRYRDMQRDTMLTFRGQPTSMADASGNIQNMLVQNGVDRFKAERLADTVLEMRQLGWSPQRIAAAAKAEGVDPEFGMALKAAKNYKFEQSPGHMYKWAIEADPKHFLDWDQRWAKQTPHVQGRVGEDMERSIATQRAALEKKIERLLRGEDDIRYRGRPGAEIMRERDLFEAQQRLQNLGLENFSGKDIYTRMGLPARSMEEGYVKSSQRLAERGIPGLQYKNVSGGADSGARNFVIFNPDTVRLLRKYGLIGLPASGLAADLMDGEGFATGGAVADRVARRIKKAGGGAFGVWSPAEQAEIDNVQPMRLVSPEVDDSPVVFRNKNPLLNITERDLNRGIEVGMGAATVGGPTRRIADDVGSAMAAARRAKRYAEPEYAPSGNLIVNKGVENPPNPAVQTVADPYRMMFPGVYRNPRIIAEEAAARVGPEDPAMKRLWGVTRGDLREMAQGRVGNEDPRLHLVKNPRGALSAQNIQTPQNTQRLIDILEEGGKHEGLRTADAWYIMDPVYRRMAELHGPEAAERYRRFNTMTGMASPGSDVTTEIARGTAAHWLNQQGRFKDFQNYAGIPEEMRGRVKFPADMRRIPGHPYHRTSQSDPMEKYLAAGEIQSKAPKVPLYVHASGVPETGFQTRGPVGDAHFSRGVGLSDTRKGPTDVQGSFSTSEYQTLQPWWQHEVAGAAGLESVPAQARLWTVLGPQTGVESALGATKLELLSQQIMEASRRLRISPERARDMILSGDAGAFMRGGAVDSAMSVARSIKRAKGGKVHVGPITGDTGGRADKVPMRVPNGAYVLTADHVSGLGEGNTEAGMKKLSAMFPKSRPSKLRQLPADEAIPIYAADGEFVISPEDVVDRFGELEYGHRALDEWQTQERQALIETLQNLAPPAQD